MLDISRREIYALVIAGATIMAQNFDPTVADDDDNRDFAKWAFATADAMILKK